jgi:hypothetical protein|tara:strand:- start:1603 stop:2967 length:1365 start_codon:yes stop_codon:yes gene_type:complete
MKLKFHKFKNAPILVISLVAGLYSGDFKIEPTAYINYYSNGGVWHHKEEGAVSFFGFGAKALKSVNNFSFEGQFVYNSAQNVSQEVFLFSRNQGIEFPNGYTFGEGFWYDYSTMKITYSTENALFDFGKFNRFWGPGIYPLIVSNKPPSYPQFGFEWDIIPSLRLKYFHGFLKSEIQDSIRASYYGNVGERQFNLPRSIAGHRLEWTPIPRVTFGATETVIYGIRGLDIHYLMPFIPFWSLQHYLGDTDNIQMSGDVSLNFENGNLYAVLFIDEWRPEWTFEEKNRNWFGWQIGFTRTELFMKSDKLEGEFSWTDHRIYRHRFSINNYYSHGYPLGFWAGPHAQELYFNYFLPFGKYNLNINYSDATRGELTRDMLEGQYNDDQHERFSGNSEHRMVIEVLIQRSFMKDQLGVQAGVELIHWKNPGFDPYKSDTFFGEDIEKWSISMGIYYNIK